MIKRLLCVLVAFAATLALTGQAFGATLIVDDDGRASPPTNCGSSMPAPNSIEAAHEASPGPDTVNVCPGTYTEQVSFESDDTGTTIRSLSVWAAIIKAPASVATNLVDDKAIVHVNAATGIRILAFTITGPGPLNCDSLRYGVWVENGGVATIQGNHITEIRDNDPLSLDPPFSGCQNGVAIQVGRTFVDGPTSGSATIIGNLLDRYQKNGMTVDNAGSNALIVDNRVQGIGPTPVIAQNGIQVSRGAVATVRGNRVQDHTYTLPAFSSTGILLFEIGPGTTVSNNLGVRSDDNLAALTTSGVRVLRNTFLDSTRFDGIYMGPDTSNNRIEENFLRGNEEHDCHDDSVGPNNPPALVANFWINNDGLTENRPGLCQPQDEEECPDDDGDDDGLTDSNELLMLTLLNNPDSDLDGIKDGNDDANGNGEDDEDEDDDEDDCPNDSDNDGEDDEDEDDD